MASRRVYVASPLGFCASGRFFNDEVLVPALEDAGMEVLDPWAGGQAIVDALGVADPAARLDALRDANALVAAANVVMIEACDAVFAVLDGVDVDSGTASEIGFAAARGKSVVGWRSDLRQAGDNEAARVNLQVEHFVLLNGGSIETSLEAAVEALTHVVGP